MKTRIAFSAIAAALICMGCSQREPSFFDNATYLCDLETGAPLSPSKALKADGVYGQWLTDGLFDSPQAISFVRINPAVFGLDIITAEGEKADSTSALCLKHGAVAGINGSFFNMKELVGITFVKDDGFTVSENSYAGSFHPHGAVIVNMDGIFIDATDSLFYASEGDYHRELMESNPILIDENQIFVYGEDTPGWESFYNFRHPRSLIGQDAGGYIWLVVVDGRAKDNAAGMTIAQLTDLAGMIGLTDALNLDGGGSSTLWTLPDGVINHPCDNRRFDNEGQRIVPNIIAVTNCR